MYGGIWEWSEKQNIFNQFKLLLSNRSDLNDMYIKYKENSFHLYTFFIQCDKFFLF